MDKRSSFGVLRSQQTGLGGIGGATGTVGLGTFAGEAVAVKCSVGPGWIDLPAGLTCRVSAYGRLMPLT